ncbi:MAG TPA: hypothetical protein VKB80_05910 [Kofleriaceae bacterium]|nr:hypothetical protein [Kofleriaceae bacterium]
MTGPYVIAIVFGALISAGLYFIFFWPAQEPDDDEDDEDSGSGS